MTSHQSIHGTAPGTGSSGRPPGDRTLEVRTRVERRPQLVHRPRPTPVDDAARRTFDDGPPEDELHRLIMREPTRYERYVKPVFDWLVAFALLLVLLPVILTITLLVWITLGSPVLLSQQRVGRNGRTFGMLKFRTMHPDRRRSADPNYTGPERRLTHKSPHDPRHTRLGRKLRRNSLDELPQLFNVLKGDMSLVGPRPELVNVVRSYRDWQNLRHLVRPGLTGLWQTTERSNGTLMHEHTELDLEYIRRLSPRTDMDILVRTPVALLKKEQVH